MTATCDGPAACVALGESIRKSAATSLADQAINARALQLFRDACERDHARGCELTAEMLVDYRSYGVGEDKIAAATTYDRACSLGLGHACYRLGFYYWEGLLEIVFENGHTRRFRWPDDRIRGLVLLRRACDELHEAKACKLIDDLRAAKVIR